MEGEKIIRNNHEESNVPHTEKTPDEFMADFRQRLIESSDDDLLKYLESEFSENPARNLLSQEDIDTLMDRCMQLIEVKITEKYTDADFGKACIVSHAVQPHGESRSDKTDHELVIDKAFRACVKLYEKHPIGGHEMMNLFGQEFTVRPDITIDSLVEAHHNPHLFEDMFQSLLYLFAFGAEAYEQRIAERLDFDNPKNFRATGIFLECIARLYTVSADTSFAEDNAPRLVNLIEQAVHNNKGSYFLNLRARAILERIRNYGHHPGVRVPKPIQQSIDGLSAEELEDLSYLESPYVESSISKDLELDLSTLDQTERRYFLNFSKNKKASEMEPIRQFIDSYGQSGMRTFLSLQYDRALGDKIVSFGQTVSKELAANVFSKYASIIDSTSGIEEHIREAYGHEATASIIDDTRNKLTKKAADLLALFIENPEEVANSKESQDELLDRLGSIRSDILVLASSFKTMRRHETVRLEDITNISLERYESGTAIPEKMREQMIKIFTDNRAHGVYPDKLAAASLEDFKSALESSDSEFYILSFQSDVLAFARFEPRGKDKLYVGSLNVRSEIKGLDIGTEFISHLVDEKSKKYSLEAVVWEHNPNLPYFIKGLKFKRAGEIIDYLSSGERFVQLERRPVHPASER